MPLRRLLAEADQRDDVDVVIQTGAAPAFYGGLELKELGSDNSRNQRQRRDRWAERRPVQGTAKPVIGAINGPAITGGLEIALVCHCSGRLASRQFGDTHARVGVMPRRAMTLANDGIMAS